MANYCVYSARSGSSTGTVAGSVPSASEWDNAYVSLSECLSGITEADGDVIFVAHDHNAAYGANATVYPAPTSGAVQILSIDRTNTTTATLKAGGAEYTNGNFSFGIGGQAYYYGMSFTAGAGGVASGASMPLASTTNTDFTTVFENCTFTLNNASSTNIGLQTPSANQVYAEARNCTFAFNQSGQRLNSTGNANPWRLVNCAITGTAVTQAIQSGTGMGTIECVGCDFSNASNLIGVGGDDTPGRFTFINCKVPSSISTGTHAGIGASTVELRACSSGDSVIDYYYEDGSGVIQESQSIYLSSGGSQTKEQDGTLTSYSLELNPSTLVSKVFPLYSPWVSRFIDSTGSKTFSMKIAYDNAAALTNAECWIEVEYYGSATTPQSTVEVSAPTAESGIARDILATGSALSDTAEAWANAGSPDWAAIKTATLAKTVTVNQQGYVRCRVAVATDVTVYVDNVVRVA